MAGLNTRLADLKIKFKEYFTAMPDVVINSPKLFSARLIRIFLIK